MKRTLATALLVSAALVATGATAIPNSPQQATDDVIAAEKGALDRWGKGDVEGYLSLYADGVTYFDPFQDRRVDGRATLRTLYGPLAGKFKVDRYEMLNPKVERYGDVAVLTYNVQNYARQPDGTERPATRWNSTAVFRRIDGRWRTIHSHWSFTKPELRTPASP